LDAAETARGGGDGAGAPAGAADAFVGGGAAASGTVARTPCVQLTIEKPSETKSARRICITRCLMRSAEEWNYLFGAPLSVLRANAAIFASTSTSPSKMSLW
jgi:hypothetical protein